MGVSLCTGPIVKGGVLDCDAEDVSGELMCNSSFFSVLQDDITPIIPTWEEDKPQLKYSLYWLLQRMVIQC